MWDGEDDDMNTLKINKDYAQKFEKREKRKELEKARHKFGDKIEKIIQEDSEDDDDSSLPEDEEAELLTENVNSKFFKTMAMLRLKDPSIYQKDQKFFDDADFEGRSLSKSLKDQDKPLYYKDLVRQQATEGRGKGNRISGETPFEEQQRLKKEFKLAAELDEENGQEEDGDLFKVKKKTKKQIQDEKTELQRFIENQKKKEPNEAEIIEKFWTDESKMDETDKFLKKFILTKGWMDKDDMDNHFDDADEEDERRDEEMEEYEEKYNFRFEEPGGQELMTYPRENPETLRQADSKRKEKRKEKEERLKEQKKQEEEEIKRLKAIHREQILSRIQKIENIAGYNLKNKEEFDKFLEKDFDPNEYDQKMQTQFDDNFYEIEDLNKDELEEYAKRLEAELDAVPGGEPKKEKKNENEEEKENGAPSKKEKSLTSKPDVNDNFLEPKTAIPIMNKMNLGNEEVKQIQDSIGGHLWWYCDTCLKGIKEGEARYECLECEDFCECKRCADLKEHPHKMKKFIVPKGCIPPSDKEIRDILDNIKYCAECSYKFTEYDKKFQYTKNSDFYLCPQCLEDNPSKYAAKEFEEIKASKVDVESIIKDDPSKLKSHYEDEELNKLIDSYYQLDFEDIISGGIKTRFKYMDVAANSYGLSDKDILYGDDKALNQFVSVKKLAPYRQDNGMINMKKSKLKKQLAKKTAERNYKESERENRKLQREEEALKSQGVGKKDIKKMIRTKRDKLQKIKELQKKKTARQSLNIIKEDQVVDEDDGFEVEQQAPQQENKQKEKKGKPAKLSSSRLKAYGFSD